MIKWGVVGLGNIAHRFVESLANFDDAEFYAGGSHNQKKREEFLNRYHAKIVYDNYEDLLNDENIDVVYIALPHNLHFEWALKAMQKGKAVFVEKPSVLTTKELKELTAYSKEHHIFFMEAMKTRFVPLTAKMHELIHDGKIGDIVRITNSYTYTKVYNANQYHFDPIQGGALYDTGIYNIASILDYIRDEVIDIEVDVHINHQVDTYTQATITFENNRKAVMTNSMEDEPNRSMVIEGTKGKMTLDPFYRAEEVIVECADTRQIIAAAIPYDDFHSEIEAVHEALAQNLVEHPLYNHGDMLRCIALMESIKNKSKK